MTARRLRRIRRHRDHPGIQAAKKRRDIVRPTGEQQDGPITEPGAPLQRRRDGPGAQVQVAVAEHGALLRVVGQKAQCQALRRCCRAILKGMGQGFGEFERVHHESPEWIR
ncbi:hypothetical protein D3C85_959640 [compost metagenome]